LTLKRFVRVSWEEYDAQRLPFFDISSVQWHGHGMERIQKTIKSGKGVVLLTGHFDSLYIGLMILAKQGVIVNLMSSKIVEDVRIPKSIQNLFKRKISAMSDQFSPGRVIHFENGMKPFVDVLKRAEVLVIACDGPATDGGRGSLVRFLGGDYFMSFGPKFFAQQTGALISMYTCIREDDQHFRIDFSEPTAIEENGLQLAFDVLDKKIRAEPWRWWASDMFQNYKMPSTD
jgi:lauroyl/myristoyl acyltransferase